MICWATTMTERRCLGVAALYRHSDHFYLRCEGADQMISLSHKGVAHLDDHLKNNETLVFNGANQTFGQLSVPPGIGLFDLDVEFRRLNNGAHPTQPIATLPIPVFKDKSGIWRYLGHLVAAGRQVEKEVDVRQAQQRGRTALDHSVVSEQGLPLNLAKLASFQQNSERQFADLCCELGFDRLFRFGQLSRPGFNDFIAANYPEVWPKKDQGVFCSDKNTLSDMAKILGGEVEVIHQLNKLARWLGVQITTDARGHNLIKQLPYGAKTGRCKAVGTSVLGLPKPIRKALLACNDRYLVEVDVSGQDIAVAAGLSGDRKMIATYEAKDFYQAAAELTGSTISNSNKSRLRNIYKLITLAVFYGMTPQTLASKLGCTWEQAANLIATYKANFPVFEDWINTNIFYATRDGKVSTASGWQMHVTENTKDRTLMNWHIQAAGADLMNLALRKALSRNLPIGAVNHDALYLSAASCEEANHAAEQINQCIQDAAAEIIPAIRVKTTTTLLGPEQALHYPSTLRELLAFSSSANEN